MKTHQLLLCAWIGLSSPAATQAAGPPLSPLQDLGRQLFFDTQLSSPPGQSCASCHDAGAARSDPRRGKPTSPGVLPGRFGNRNTPTALYAKFSPPFHYDAEEGLYIGGQFLDGRAADLEAQAKGPFLNPLEMANPDQATVVDKVRNAAYANAFRQVFGTTTFADTGQAYANIAVAIAAFERTEAFAPFSSKYDAYLARRTALSPSEQRGLAVYEDPAKGNCAACHPSQAAADGTPPLFTDFTYDNLGVPPNPANPFYTLPSALNPQGANFVDLGLGQSLGDSAENGKFKVPTLRNIAKTGPYMHNGYFATLRGVVEFYNDRDRRPRCANPMTPESQALQQGCWPAAEVVENVNGEELGDLGLNAQEVDDLVAFMRTLTDGYGDVDQDGDVDNGDLALVTVAKNRPASGADDARDLNADGRIDLLDARKLSLLCTRRQCATQ